jgi:enolase-phosphatase E1
VSLSLSALKTRALLLDIEGTTTPVEFVYQVLFPFARRHAAAYLAREWASRDCRAAIAQLRRERASDRDASDATTSGVGLDVSRSDSDAASDPGVLDYVYSLMDRDKKSPGLKALQGLIWQDGYQRGELRGQVFPDVRPAFERWRARHLEIYIYSSGSVLAQQLLFRSTEAGDLTRFLNGYFDTGVGPKTSPGSYAEIAERIHTPAPEILFVSDIAQELDAAEANGMRTALCVRGDNRGAGAGAGAHAAIVSFDAIVD